MINESVGISQIVKINGKSSKHCVLQYVRAQRELKGRYEGTTLQRSVALPGTLAGVVFLECRRVIGIVPPLEVLSVGDGFIPWRIVTPLAGR